MVRCPFVFGPVDFGIYFVLFCFCFNVLVHVAMRVIVLVLIVTTIKLFKTCAGYVIAL
jgi:hypothetical protein